MNLKNIPRKELLVYIMELCYILFGLYLFIPYEKKVVTDMYTEIIPMKNSTGINLILLATLCLIMIIVIMLKDFKSNMIKYFTLINPSILGLVFFTINNFSAKSLIVTSVACILMDLIFIKVYNIKNDKNKRIGFYVAMGTFLVLALILLGLGYFPVLNLLSFVAMTLMGVILLFLRDVILKSITY